MTNILILCTHNSARSILAEAMLNHLAIAGRHAIRGYSAGSAPGGRVNPLAIEALSAAGVDVSALRSKSWDEFDTPGAPVFRAVITVCDNAARETCPFYPGNPIRVHWGYPDPSNSAGGDDERRVAFDLTRQALGYRMLQLLSLPVDFLDDEALRAALVRIASS